MTEIIYKYEIQTGTGQGPIKMPKGAEILCVQMQNGRPHIWAKVDADSPILEDKTLVTYATGESMLVLANRHHMYVGTYQTSGGFVYHLFEIMKRGE